MVFNKITIGQRITVGFCCVLVLLSAIGVLSYTGVSSIVNNASQVINGNRLDGTLAQKEVDHLNWIKKVNALFTDENVMELNVETDDHQCGFGKWLYGEERKEAERLEPGLKPLLKAIEEPHRHLHESAIAIAEVYKYADEELPVLLVKRESDHLKWASKIRDAFLKNSDSLDVETDPTKCALGKWLGSEGAKKIVERGSADFRKTWDKMADLHRNLHESAIEIQTELKNSPDTARSVFEENTLPMLEETLKHLNGLRAEAEQELRGTEKAKEIYATQTLTALHEVQDNLHKIRKEAKENILSDTAMLNAAHGTKRNVTILGIAALAAGILLAVFISRGIIQVLQQIVNQMSEGADQVASASGQVSTASQSLAEGASQQAASIEETSSSLEELSSMTKQNANNAAQADSLMNEANRIVGEANDSMNGLTKSMDEISKASEAISKIIKTIDEIAFQTNLLALNAAVEAARAGDAGAGFAVVADEVRNLAMKAAKAAKSTANLIEETVKTIGGGSGQVIQTNEAFSKVAESAAKVGELVSEITSASNEQAKGIAQVNKAVAEMDKVVQETAANAEESASAAEEMHGQCQVTYQMVEELKALVNGAAPGRRFSVDIFRNNDEKRAGQILCSSHGLTKEEKTDTPLRRTREVRPDDEILLDSGGFNHF